MAAKKQKKAVETVVEESPKKRVSVMMYQEEIDSIRKACEGSTCTMRCFLWRGAMMLAKAEHHIRATRKKPVPCIKCGGKDLEFVRGSENDAEKGVVNTGKGSFLKCANCGATSGSPENFPVLYTVERWLINEYLLKMVENMAVGRWNEENEKKRRGQSSAAKKQKKAVETTAEKPTKKRVSITIEQADIDTIQGACDGGEFTMQSFFRCGAMLLASAALHVKSTRKNPVPCIKCGCKDIEYVKEKEGSERRSFMKCGNCGATSGELPGLVPLNRSVGEWYFDHYLYNMVQNTVIADWNKTNKKKRKK